MREWAPYFGRISRSPPSGVPQEEWYEKATELHDEETDSVFAFQHVAKILQGCPVFMAQIRPTDYPPINPDFGGGDEVHIDIENINNTLAMTGAGLPRPIGQKKAKAKALKEREDERKRKASNQSGNSIAISTIGLENANISHEMKVRNKVSIQTNKLSVELLRLDKRNANREKKQKKIQNLFQMIELFHRGGNTVKADELMEVTMRMIMNDDPDEEDVTDSFMVASKEVDSTSVASDSNELINAVVGTSLPLSDEDLTEHRVTTPDEAYDEVELDDDQIQEIVINELNNELEEERIKKSAEEEKKNGVQE
jgi:hypothetical protein